MTSRTRVQAPLDWRLFVRVCTVVVLLVALAYIAFWTNAEATSDTERYNAVSRSIVEGPTVAEVTVIYLQGIFYAVLAVGVAAAAAIASAGGKDS